jgi:succinate dehydrogenase / fumarate reductase cytochrome b subunit
MTSIHDAQMVGRDSQGRLVRRPLSPHLQIYRPQIGSVLSIAHRATGIALALGTLLLTWWLVAAATSDSAFAAVQWFASSVLGFIVLFGWTLSLCYHFLAGIRHLAWDTGWGYDLPTTYRTGYAVLIGTAVLTVLIWIVALVVWL